MTDNITVIQKSIDGLEKRVESIASNLDDRLHKVEEFVDVVHQHSLNERKEKMRAEEWSEIYDSHNIGLMKVGGRPIDGATVHRVQDFMIKWNGLNKAEMEDWLKALRHATS